MKSYLLQGCSYAIEYTSRNGLWSNSWTHYVGVILFFSNGVFKMKKKYIIYNLDLSLKDALIKLESKK